MPCLELVALGPPHTRVPAFFTRFCESYGIGEEWTDLSRVVEGVTDALLIEGEPAREEMDDVEERAEEDGGEATTSDYDKREEEPYCRFLGKLQHRV